jgi:hypothetical protein
MDEKFRRNKHWFGLGALLIIFLCVALCGLGAMATMFTRSAPNYGAVPYVQPPAVEEGVAPPATYYGHGPLGHHGGWGPFGIIGMGIGLIFKLLFFGLLVLLLLGLVKRLFWGHRHWGHGYWGPPCPPGKPWKGTTGESEDESHAEWGPRAWHRHFKHWGPPPWWGPEPKTPDSTSEPDTDEPEYTGPQE